MRVYWVEWVYSIKVACKIHHNLEPRNKLHGKSNGLHVKGYPIVCKGLKGTFEATLCCSFNFLVLHLPGFL